MELGFESCFWEVPCAASGDSFGALGKLLPKYGLAQLLRILP